jgi:hypothetical protein
MMPSVRAVMLGAFEFARARRGVASFQMHGAGQPHVRLLGRESGHSCGRSVCWREPASFFRMKVLYLPSAHRLEPPRRGRVKYDSLKLAHSAPENKNARSWKLRAQSMTILVDDIPIRTSQVLFSFCSMAKAWLLHLCWSGETALSITGIPPCRCNTSCRNPRGPNRPSERDCRITVSAPVKT